MNEHPDPDELEHTAMNELIPWYLNGTLDESARRRLDRHLPTCLRCRADLNLERAVHAKMTAQPAVEYMPVASLKRLNATLDELQAGTEHRSDVLPAAQPLKRTARKRLPLERFALAASLVLVAVGIGLVMVDRVTVDRMASRGDSESASYHTVTTARAKPPHETIRAVFDPAMTVIELQTLLDDAGLSIVAGPTEAGVYSLAPTSTLATASSLEILRRHAGVRFAESAAP